MKEVDFRPKLRIQPDDIWKKIQGDFNLLKSSEPTVYSYLRGILHLAADFPAALAALLFHHLFDGERNAQMYFDQIAQITQQNPDICDAAAADLEAFYERDPASQSLLQVFFFSKGYCALQAYRIAHVLWQQEQRLSAHLLQVKTSLVFAVDIHPAARLGRGIFLDHATGLVIGETCVVEDEVSILHEVTLGGTGKHRGDRHPKIRKGALLCAGAKILGNIEVGEGAKVGAGSVVLHNVPAHATVAGVPAKVVAYSRRHPALEMDQTLTG